MQSINKSLLKKKIFISGVSGYIGMSLYKNLKKFSKNVVATTRDVKLIKFNSDFKKANYNKSSFWSDAIDYADVIVHLSADTSLDVEKASIKKNFDSNVLPVNLFIQESLKKKKKIQFIFSSSTTVAGLSKNKTITERVKPFPNSIYDKHKLINENNLINLSKKNKNISSTILRLSNVYGYSFLGSKNKKKGFLNFVMQEALVGNEIKIYGDGKFYRDYIHIEDVITSLKAVMFKNESKSNIYNISTGKSYYLIDAVKMIINNANQITNLKSKINMIPFPVGLNDIEKRNYKISSNKIKKLKWFPKYTLKNGINTSLKQFLNDRDY